MKLNICKRCFKVHGLEWDANDKKMWQSGFISCPSQACCSVSGFYWYRLGGKPPDRCFYQLEHEVLNQKKLK